MSLHLPFGIALALGIVGMILSDGSSTFETLAKVRSRYKLAAFMDALGDDAGLMVQVSAVGSIFIYGASWKAALVVLAINITSFIGTWAWTAEANVLIPEKVAYLGVGGLGRAAGIHLAGRRERTVSAASGACISGEVTAASTVERRPVSPESGAPNV